MATENRIMTKRLYTKIVGTGSYIPTRTISNDYFKDFVFFDACTKQPLEKSNEEIIQKFKEIQAARESRKDMGRKQGGRKHPAQDN